MANESGKSAAEQWLQIKDGNTADAQMADVQIEGSTPASAESSGPAQGQLAQGSSAARGEAATPALRF